MRLLLGLLRSDHRLIAVFAGGAVGLLGGCASAVTYGTGTSTTTQLYNDITGMVSLSSESKANVDYKPRAGIVLPPNANLPPPRAGQATALADWPNDPDVATQRVRAIQASKDSDKDQSMAARQDPGFRIPKGTSTVTTNDAAGFAALAAAKKTKGGSVGADGKPTREYLTEPPVSYREPDPTQPTDLPKNKPGTFSLGKLWPF